MFSIGTLEVANELLEDLDSLLLEFFDVFFLTLALHEAAPLFAILMSFR